MKKFFKKPIVIIGLVVFVIIIVIFFWQDESEAVYDYITVQRGDLKQFVEVTGQIKAAESLDLAFETSGQVKEVKARVGDIVSRDDILVALDDTNLSTQLEQTQAELSAVYARLDQYEAALAIEEAKLDELARGTRTEEIQLAATKAANAQKSLADAETNLDNTEALTAAQLAQAEQTVANAETNLANVQAKADLDLANAYEDVIDILNDGYTKVEEAVVSKTEAMFSNDNYSSPQLTFTTVNLQAEIDAEWARYQAGSTLVSFKADITNLSASDYDKLAQVMVKAEGYLDIVQDLFDALNEALNNTVGLSATTLDTYKTDINAALTNINTIESNINIQQQTISSQERTNQNNIGTAEATLNDAKETLEVVKVTNAKNSATAQASVNEAENALATAKDELALKKAGATAEQIAAQEAGVRQAEANISSQKAVISQTQAKVDNLNSQLAKTVLKAPINGIISKQEAKKGEIITANVEIISLISAADFEIEAHIAEVDLAKVKVNDMAKVTLDAYGDDEIFNSRVVKIDPAETIIEGVPTYKVTFHFIKESNLIKSGLTANIDILTAYQTGVIYVPQRAVISKNSSKIVRVLNSREMIEEVEVTTGIRSSDGNIEIILGLNEGDQVITYLP